MTFQIVKKWATIGCVALIAVVGLTQYGRAQGQSKASFFCGTDNGEPATIARLPQSNSTPILRTFIVWRIDDFEGYPPQKRCRLVSQKFQDNQATGDLRYIVSGKANGWYLLCASKQKHSYIVECADPNILMTLLPGDDSQGMIRQLVELNIGRSKDPLKHQGADELLVESGDLVAIDVAKMLVNSPEKDTSTSVTPSNDSTPTDTKGGSQCIWGCD